MNAAYIIIFRRYTQDSNSSYYHEKYYTNHNEPTPELPGWDNNTIGDDGEHAIPVHLFPKHASELHMDQVYYQSWFLKDVYILYSPCIQHLR